HEMAEHIARIQNESFAPLQEHHAQKAITSWNTAMSGTRPELVITVTAPETNHSALLNFRNQTEAISQNNINTVMSEINSNIGTDNPNFAALKDKLNNLNSSISSDRAISTVIQNNPQILNQLNSTNTADHYLALISLEEAMTAATTPHNTIFMDTSRAMIYRTIGASSNLNLAAMTSTHVIENYSAIVNLDGLETFVEQTKNSIGVLKNPQRITFNTILNDPSNASILTNLQSDNQAKKQLGAFQLYQAIESHTDKVKLHNYLEKNIAPPRGEKVRRTDGRYTINWNPTELATVNTISIKDLLDKTAEASRIVAKLDKFTKEVDAELTQTLGPDLARVINKLTIEENQPTENVARINSLETSINNVRESTKPSNPTASQTSFSKFLDNLLNAIFEAIKGKYAAKA
ncbi:MAG: hypothetical protein O3C63_09615, partial [Cyanobacteria bacterium]|nr:hypothetical protein [Cyanobacteriota bacterium]